MQIQKNTQRGKGKKVYQRGQKAPRGGGRKGSEAQKQKGKCTARERIAMFLDEDSF